MDVSTIDSLIAVGGSIASSLIGSGMSNKNARAAQRRANNYTLGQMAVANQYNIDAFNRENAYNDPLAQKMRLRNAGINTNFIDGGVALGDQSSSVNGNSSPVVGNPPDFNTAIDAYFRSKEFNQAKKLNDSVVEKNRADARLTDAQADVQEQYGLQTADMMIELARASRDLSKAQAKDILDTLDSRIDFLKSQKDLTDAQKSELDKLTDARYELLNNQSRLASSQSDYYDELPSLTREGIESSSNTALGVANINASASRYSADRSASASMYGANLNYKASHESNIISNKAVDNLGKLQSKQGKAITLDNFRKGMENAILSWSHELGLDKREVIDHFNRSQHEIKLLYNEFVKSGYDLEYLQKTISSSISKSNMHNYFPYIDALIQNAPRIK